MRETVSTVDLPTLLLEIEKGYKRIAELEAALRPLATMAERRQCERQRELGCDRDGVELVMSVREMCAVLDVMRK